MPAYATHEAQLEALPSTFNPQNAVTGGSEQILECLISQLADRVTAAVVAQLDGSPAAESE